MKKIFALLICFCLFAGVLTACAPADTGTAPAGRHRHRSAVRQGSAEGGS